MKEIFRKKWVIAATMALVAVLGVGSIGLAHADDEGNQSEEDKSGQISISISPVNKTFNLNSNSVYEGVMNVTNAGTEAFEFEVYSAPYSFALSNITNDYGPDYNSENTYTQLARWITIRDQAGNYVSSLKSDSEETRPTFSAAPGETVEVAYKITTPDNIPAGGQYAALFAQTKANPSEQSGINALANLGMKIFGRSEEGEAIQSAEIYNMELSRDITKTTEVEENGQTVEKETKVDHNNGHATIKNTGNLDFTARGVLKVTNIFGGVYYETPSEKAQVTIIPESELPISDEWTETPTFGIYKASWTVTAADASESVDMVIFMIPPYVVIIAIILLTIVIVWIIMMVRRRKERRSRFTI